MQIVKRICEQIWKMVLDLLTRQHPRPEASDDEGYIDTEERLELTAKEVEEAETLLGKLTLELDDAQKTLEAQQKFVKTNTVIKTYM